MILYNTTDGPIVEHAKAYFAVRASWDDLLTGDNLAARLRAVTRRAGARVTRPPASRLLAPIGSQEVWAAGVTYDRSRVARMSESKDAGGSDFYDRVYHAERPELFFKATPHRVVGPGGLLHRRRDSSWIVPEPELTLAVNPRGRIIGYTIGNDMSCRDIEGENPLYLPQAKTFSACAALGPGVLVTSQPLPPSTPIRIAIRRAGRTVFAGTTHVARIRKPLPLLVEYLFRDTTFPAGCVLMTGTGIVPPGRFTLKKGDVVRITVPPIGVLTNTMD
jgi:2-dehydro-3-deoxy-D-arabinonate dehydratase